MDAIDQKILELLTKNARVVNRHIAKVVGTSDRTVARRIMKLEKQGIITGYTIKLGRGVHHHIDPQTQQRVNASLSEWESIRKALTRFFGSGATVILYYIGYGIGQDIGHKMRQTRLTRGNQIVAFTQVLEDRGWGTFEFDTIDFNNARGRIRLVNSPVFPPTHQGIHHELRGIITGFLETVFDAKVMVNRVRPDAGTTQPCTFMFHEVRTYGV